MNYLFYKRVIDFCLSIFVLGITWPFFLLISIVIKIDSKGPVLFKQERIGKNKEKFYILKFRTMKTCTPNDMPTHLLKDPNAFITRSGRLLRKTSLDELPQLINIVKGDMSFVGPRPALWNQYDLISERDKYKANDIFPGLTGLAQVNGRDELPIDAKAKLDGEYTRNCSLILDIKCLIKTFTSVLKAEGVVEGKIEKKIKGEKKTSSY
ncbi:O-antigen biosynthesis protein WbqP [Terribacillus halophilus]|uniref:O-antigen biosynthesis protein WbqP n=1 Tax=Terribacillus halophilus TaxID=361279 RepID=A0A1G6IKH7_9BACI|nr:sugar transferase [Terribacillus halophilus]SDC06923.1 O-antigen biosynthesis protein WbqP [Terribacillus halophilus]